MEPDTIINKIITFWTRLKVYSMRFFPQKQPIIDVNDLLTKYSLDELNQTAEQYFAQINNWEYHLSKPLASPEEASELLANFAQIVKGLKLHKGQRVLDFGCGSCWSTRFLTQMGTKSYALDVSETALKMGKKLFDKLPIIGEHESPVFLKYDGITIPLGDSTIDRIMCLDAFHHIPNQSAVLSEMFRVLKDGGIIGFSEAGRRHSKSPQSQWEMKNHVVIERDTFIRKVWKEAKQIGFSDLQLAIYSSHTNSISFNNYFSPSVIRNQIVTQAKITKDIFLDKRIFFLFKGPLEGTDSRTRKGLKADLKVVINQSKSTSGHNVEGSITVVNTSKSIFLPSNADFGAVNIGVHLLDHNGKKVNQDWSRISLSDKSMFPKEHLEVRFSIPSPSAKGKHMLEFDLVSEGVCWFALNGSHTIIKDIEVI